jgi:hypothetical protein
MSSTTMMMRPADVLARDDFPHHFAAPVGIAVAGHVDVVEFEREGQLGQQVAGEYHGAAHHAQHQREGAAVVVVETRVEDVGDLADGRVDLVGADDFFGMGHQFTGPGMVKILHGHGIE